MFLRSLFVVSTFSMLMGCGDPLNAFYTELKRYGYIPYTTPLEVAGTGTLIGGSPKAMSIVANPRTCFPEVGTGEDAIRFRDETVLPSTKEHFFVNTDIKFKFMKALGAGAPSIKAGLKLNNVQTMELEFDGVHVEYFDSVRLVSYYRTHMSDVCKEYLDKVGFIIQAIVTDKMKFTLFTKDGGRIQLTMENMNQYFDLAADIEWEVDRTSSLIIKTPKYIGYQLGQMRQKDNGLVLSRATQVLADKWIFRDIGVFKDFN